MLPFSNVLSLLKCRLMSTLPRPTKEISPPCLYGNTLPNRLQSRLSRHKKKLLTLPAFKINTRPVRPSNLRSSTPMMPKLSRKSRKALTASLNRNLSLLNLRIKSTLRSLLLILTLKLSLARTSSSRLTRIKSNATFPSTT